MKKILIISTALLFLTACQNSTTVEPNQQISREKPQFTLKSSEIIPQINLTGNIIAEKEIPISAKIVGRIDSVRSEVGDYVQKGQILARYSAVDNDSLVRYQSALSQLKSVETSAENAVNTAQVQLESQERAFNQIKKEQKIQLEKQATRLQTSAKLSEINISNALNFLDKNLEVSNKYKGMGTFEAVLGTNNFILKNKIKNEVSNFVLENEKPVAQTSEILFANQKLNLLKKVKNMLVDFDNLVRQSVVSSRFPEKVKVQFITETNVYLDAVSKNIMDLENLISGTSILTEQLDLKVLSAENALKTVESNLELAKSNAQNQVVAANSQVNIAANYQQEMVVKAPFSGIITRKTIEIGQLVGTGQVMFQIADISGFKIKTEIADTEVGMVHLDTPVEIKVDGLTENFAGTVTKINPSLNPQTRKLGIEITISEPEEADYKLVDKLKIGLFARLKMVLPPQKTFFIPRNFVKFSVLGPQVLLNDQLVGVKILSEKSSTLEITFPEIKEGLTLTAF